MTLSGRCILLFLLLYSGLFLSSALSPARAGDAAGLPFSPGEEIRYHVKWQMYKAGEAVVRVLPKASPPDPWRFELKAKSNPFIDKFFKVRDHLESVVEPDFSKAVSYAFTGTGKKKKQIRVTFFKDPDRARYANFDEIREPIEIPAGAVDPLSAYFKLRTLDFPAGQTISFPVTDGKKAFMQMGDVVGKERLVLPSGTWDTVVVVPWVTHFSGVFEKSDDPTVRVWISDDARRLPVRIRIRVVVGSIYFDLAGYTPGLPGEPEDAGTAG